MDLIHPAYRLVLRGKGQARVVDRPMQVVVDSKGASHDVA
jgi:hypothetical protein